MRWSRTLWAAVALGVAILAGCAYDPDAMPPARTQAQRSQPTPGSMTVHMNGSVTSEATVAR